MSLLSGDFTLFNYIIFIYPYSLQIYMTRTERLEFCTICLHRKMNVQKGLLCGLTGEYANFDDHCQGFSEDKDKKEQQLKRNLEASGHHNASNSIDYKKNKQNGAIILIIGILVLMFTFVNIDSFGVYVIPFGAIIYGVRTYNKGVEQEKVVEKSKKFNKDSKSKN